MPKITFISAAGDEYKVDATSGQSLMQTALENLVPGIDADCGGQAACGTCHVFIDPAWVGKIGPAGGEHEQQMLSLTDNVQENSRLSCQVILNDETDGLVVRIPQAQH